MTSTLSNSLFLELDIMLVFHIHHRHNGKKVAFWVRVPIASVRKYRLSPYRFIRDLCCLYPITEITRLQKINVCHYIDNVAQGIEWILKIKGEVNQRTYPKRGKCFFRLIQQIKSGQIDESVALHRHHVRLDTKHLEMTPIACPCGSNFISHILPPRKHVALAECIDL